MKRFVASFVGALCFWIGLSAFIEPAAAQPGSITWKEPLTGMEFVRIPAGCFEFRCPADTGRSSSSTLCTDGFWLGIHEVTRGQFRVFIEATGYRTDAEREGFSWAYSGQWEKRAGQDWRNAGFPQDDRHPVVNVSWNDAKAMAKWLSEKNREHFRLPTESEWEYACGDRQSAESSPDAESVCRQANVADATALESFPAWKTRACRDGHVHTAPVGSLRPDRFGLYDLVGNVWEWCEDVCISGTGSDHAMNKVVPAKHSIRVVRGNGWNSGPGLRGCAARETLQVPERRGNDVGFRLMRAP